MQTATGLTGSALVLYRKRETLMRRIAIRKRERRGTLDLERDLFAVTVKQIRMIFMSGAIFVLVIAAGFIQVRRPWR